MPLLWRRLQTYHRHHRFCSRSCSDKGYKHRGGRKDHNHDFIVEQFKAKGFLVHDTHLIGYGFPDLIIQKNGITKLIEIKNPKWHKQYGLTKWQKEFSKTFVFEVVMDIAGVDRIVSQYSDFAGRINEGA